MSRTRRKYHLQVCPGESLQGPTDDEIVSAVSSLPGGIPSFVVLTKKKSHFMQVGGSAKDGFELEYQEYSLDGHWRHVRSPDVDLETVLKTILWYANDDERWLTENIWHRLGLQPPSK